MSTNEDQLVSQGQDAEILLKNENFNKVVKALLDQYVQVFFNTDPSQTDERNIAYYSARSIQEVINTLNQQVLMKNQILKKNEE
jgi:NADPH:quinone reductase-like Zn-dependent oxidoreductase